MGKIRQKQKSESLFLSCARSKQLSILKQFGHSLQKNLRNLKKNGRYLDLRITKDMVTQPEKCEKFKISKPLREV